MKVVQRYPFGKGPFFEDGCGLQQVIALVTNDFDFYVCFLDTLRNETYIERVINKNDNAYKSGNLYRIENDNEYFSVLGFLVDEGIIKKI